MAEKTMRYAIEAEDKTKAGLASAQSGLAGFARQAATVAAGFATYDFAKSALSTIGGFLRDSATAAMEAQTQLTAYTVVLANAGNDQATIDGLYAQAEAIGKVGGVSKETVMQIQSGIAEYGYQGDVITELTGKIVDYVAIQKGANATTDDARNISNGFGKAMQGQFDLLTKSGFKLDEAQKETLQFGDAMERASVMAELLGTTYEGANAALGDTAEGKIRKLNAAYGDLQESIGNALLPSMDLFIPAITDQTNAAGKAIEQNNVWAKSIYSFMSGVKAAVYTLEGLAKAILTGASVIVSFVAVVAAFVVDVVRGFQQVQRAGQEMASGLFSLMTGDFSGALDKFKNGLNIAKSIDLGATRAVFNTMGGVVTNFANSTADSFAKAGAAMAEGVEQKGFKPIQAASAKTKDKVINDATGAAKKVSDAYSKAYEKIGDLAESSQGKIADMIDSYGEKTQDNLEKHLEKIQDFNQKLRETQSDFEASSIQNEGDYNASRLDLYMGHQDKLKELQQKSQDLRTSLGEEEDAQKRNLLQAQVDEVRKAITKEQAIIDENSDLLQQANQYRNTTDLDRLKAKYEAQQVADKAAFDVKMASIRTEMEQENIEYAKQSERLRADTGKRFEDILSEYRKGYEKILQESKTKGKELAGLQAQAKADLDQLVNTATTALGIVAGTSKNAGTQAVKGGVGAPQFNFTFTGTVTDKDTLVKTIVDAVNRANAVASAAKAW